MFIKVGYEIGFNFPEAVPMLLLLRLHPSREQSIQESETFTVRPKLPVREFIDVFRNRCCRVFAPAGPVSFSSDAVVDDSGQPDPQSPDAKQHAVEELPDDTLQFLLGSRYCEVDSELNDFAWNRFADAAPGWERVQAICDFVHDHIHDVALQMSVGKSLRASNNGGPNLHVYIGLHGTFDAPWKREKKGEK